MTRQSFKGFVATAGSCSEEDSEEEDSEEEENEEGNTSDEFYLDDDDKPKVRKVGRPPTKRTKKSRQTKRRGKGAKKKG
jgi:hypothetical protein